MFRQIRIFKEDQLYQNILWRNDSKKPLTVFRLTTVTYGTASAPFLAVRSLIKIAEDCNEERVKKVIEEDFYMDDLMTGADSVQECSEIKQKVEQQLMKFGFHLRKWLTNNSSVLEDSMQQRSEENYLINSDEIVKTLGLKWDPKKMNSSSKST